MIAGWALLAAVLGAGAGSYLQLALDRAAGCNLARTDLDALVLEQ